MINPMDFVAPLFAAAILLQSTQPVALPDPPESWVKLITAVTALLAAVAALWALLKSQKAETKSDATEQRQNNTAADVRNLQQGQVEIAKAMPPPSEPKPPYTPGLP